MTYNTDFYKAYENYLHEKTVRKMHDWMFSIIKFDTAFDYVLDLGCGLNEFKRFARPRSYMGIDLNCHSTNVKQADYRNCNIKEVLGAYKPLSFVSLFSSEITASYKENYEMYKKLFTDLNLKSALVAGFRYGKRSNAETVVENGGITSYQTLESIESVENDVFSEKRIVMPVPSKLFGDDVYEIWKIFEKR